VERGEPVVSVNNPLNVEKQRAVIRAVEEGVAHMNTIDTINLTDSTLKKLGIGK
jgi:hypothetical protein